MVEKFLNTDDLKTDELRLRLEKAAPGDPQKGWVPAYHFAICDLRGEKMGACDLRLGHNDLLYYGGNIGYRVEEPYRGHHYAAKACRLLFELAKRHALEYVIITCNPENIASRKTCEYLGGTLLEIAELPPDSDMREKGETHKCIFRFDL
ncbi:MAG: GNAT family N-acetyltransferase [Clostridia bacterium]|nr:GNAT family N-acetyltransferase [Clostridia bacterium]